MKELETLPVATEGGGEEDSAAQEKYREELMGRLDRIFRRAGQGSETLALYRAIVRYRTEHRS